MSNAVDTPVNSAPETPLTTPEQPVIKTEAEKSFWELRVVHIGQLYFIKIVAVILMLQGLKALYNSISFIFMDMPQLEQLLLSNQISQIQINSLANKAIIMIISTILSLFFALRITVVQSKLAQIINTIIAIFIIIGNTQISNLLDKIGSTQLITSIFLDSIKAILSP